VLGRIVPWALLGTVSPGVAAATALAAASPGPEPGADMVLMGLPLLALPTCLSGAAAEYDAELGRWERRAGYVAGGVSVLVLVPLVVLG
jgi:hypothetical protein